MDTTSIRAATAESGSLSVLTVALAVGAGGAAGALSRLGLASLVQRMWPASIPLGTLAVNLSGCLAIGWFWARLDTESAWRMFLIVGFLGAFTTFSSYGMELFQLVRSGAIVRALVYLGASNAAGLLLVAVGFRLGDSR